MYFKHREFSQKRVNDYDNACASYRKHPSADTLRVVLTLWGSMSWWERYKSKSSFPETVVLEDGIKSPTAGEES